MISLSIKKIILYWIKNEIIQVNEIDIYEFGLDLLLYSIINFSIIFITAIFMGRLVESLLLFIIMIPLQSIGGGYHARTHLRCFLIMYIGWWIMMWIFSFIHSALAMLITIASIAIIFFLAPVPNENVPISNIQRKKLKTIINIMLVVILCFSIINYLFLFKSDVNFCGLLAMGMGGIAISMVIARLKKHHFFAK